MGEPGRRGRCLMELAPWELPDVELRQLSTRCICPPTAMHHPLNGPCTALDSGKAVACPLGWTYVASYAAYLLIETTYLLIETTWVAVLCIYPAQ
jgi:hypothetical protein